MPQALGGPGASWLAPRLMDALTSTLPFAQLFREPRNLRGDLRLLRRAMREGWPIPAESRRVLMERVANILEEPEGVPESIRTRATVAACWVVLEADRENLRATLGELGEPLGVLRLHRARRT